MWLGKKLSLQFLLGERLSGEQGADQGQEFEKSKQKIKIESFK